jgi:alkylhydroperoxidase/carboxymuconolactone decarboxylase family protein YurZ
MSDDLLLRGLATRRELSSDYEVDAAFADPHPCVQMFEEFSTEHYWGGCWSDETLNHRERSWLCLGIAASTGRSRDFAAAVETALRSGINEPELRAAIRQIVVCCGTSIGSECVRIAREVLNRTKRSTTVKSIVDPQRNPHRAAAAETDERKVYAANQR